MKGWKCLDCRKTWDGPAGERVKVDGRWTNQLTETGEAVRQHVLAFGHSCVPTMWGDPVIDDG